MHIGPASHQFSKHLLKTYSVLSTMPGTGVTKMNGTWSLSKKHTIIERCIKRVGNTKEQAIDCTVNS